MNIEDLRYTTTVEVTKTVADFYCKTPRIPKGYRAVELRPLRLGDLYISSFDNRSICEARGRDEELQHIRLVVEKIPKKKRWIVEQLNDDPRDSKGYRLTDGALLFGDTWCRVVGEVSEDEYGNE